MDGFGRRYAQVLLMAKRVFSSSLTILSLPPLLSCYIRSGFVLFPIWTRNSLWVFSNLYQGKCFSLGNCRSQPPLICPQFLAWRSAGQHLSLCRCQYRFKRQRLEPAWESIFGFTICLTICASVHLVFILRLIPTPVFLEGLKLRFDSCWSVKCFYYLRSLDFMREHFYSLQAKGLKEESHNTSFRGNCTVNTKRAINLNGSVGWYSNRDMQKSFLASIT